MTRRWLSPRMRIDVARAATVPAQMRAYAEYRIFAALARRAKDIRHIHVQLEAGDEAGGSAQCTVTIDLEGIGRVRSTGRGAPLRAAIDEAAERAAALLGAPVRRARAAPEFTPDGDAA
ncbi:MAG TPA: HPF/RaiA family ribosome-associated protein [Vicinamibacterales bacterium]|nr:HPF/RaiA family ribosome-associated protein [Vicinamibacterales bacterium]